MIKFLPLHVTANICLSHKVRPGPTRHPLQSQSLFIHHTPQPTTSYEHPVSGSWPHPASYSKAGTYPPSQPTLYVGSGTHLHLIDYGTSCYGSPDLTLVGHGTRPASAPRAT
ncbi:hypothetical protein P167DRAFT_209399 [Morchella conica CCBAS932]|uniref:Uncharacterized protein n=1 Tax=Morchella conica CCBAS932 TaxID=1392247 RepID=A0A3N4L0U9_9PEZI|nr:hypothetical protein P167DRAFT_209399 [Morchella conica CCBAS932]